MTPSEFKAIRSGLDLTQADLARYLRVSARAVRYYESGDRSIPGPVARLMEIFDQCGGPFWD